MKTSKGHICKGCRTPGCPQCKWRHNYDVSIGKAPKRRRCCKTCGTPYTDFNMDCDLCRKRYRVKLIREAGDEHEPKTCAGCGGGVEITHRNTLRDVARFIKSLQHEDAPKAEIVHRIKDHLTVMMLDLYRNN